MDFETVLGSKPTDREEAVASYNVACCYSKLGNVSQYARGEHGPFIIPAQITIPTFAFVPGTQRIVCQKKQAEQAPWLVYSSVVKQFVLLQRGLLLLQAWQRKQPACP